MMNIGLQITNNYYVHQNTWNPDGTRLKACQLIQSNWLYRTQFLKVYTVIQ